MAAVYKMLHFSTWFDNLFDETLIIWFEVNVLLGRKCISNTSLNFPTFLSNDTYSCKASYFQICVYFLSYLVFYCDLKSIGKEVRLKISGVLCGAFFVWLFFGGGGCCGFCLFSAFIPEKAGKGVGTVSEGSCVAGRPLLALLICEGHALCSTLVDNCSLLLSLFPVSVVSFCVLLLLGRNQTQSVFIVVLFAVWEPERICSSPFLTCKLVIRDSFALGKLILRFQSWQ